MKYFEFCLNPIFIVVLFVFGSISGCSVNFNFKANSPTLSVTSPYVLVNTSRQITASGGSEPYAYTVVSGEGNVSADGLFTAGNTSGDVLIAVSDTIGVAGTITLTVYSEISAPVQATTGGSTLDLIVSGGIPPYHFAVASGSGTVSGSTFTASATNTFTKTTVTATDSIANISIFSVYTIGNPKIWFRPDELSSYSHGDPIAAWPDVSGNHNDALQATEALQPSIDRNTGIGGSDVGTVTFSSNQKLGLSEFMNTPDFTIILAGIAFSMGDYFFYDEGDTALEVLGFGSTASNALAGFSSDNGFDSLLATGPAGSASTFSVYDWVAHHSASTHTLYRDGVPAGSATNASYSTTQVYSGTHATPSLGPMISGTITEIMIYPTDLTNPQRAVVDCYLDERYDATVSGC